MLSTRRRSTFWRDTTERATKSLGAGVGTYLLEEELDFSHLGLPARTILFGVGLAAASVLTSLMSRRVGTPQSGSRTASLVKEIDYVD